MYAFHLYMKVAQPEYSVLFDSWHRTKKIYYLEVGCVTIIGTLPYIVLASLSKYQIVQYPPLFCALNAKGSFYGIVLPTVLVNCATLIILLLVLYHVHIVSDYVALSHFRSKETTGQYISFSPLHQAIKMISLRKVGIDNTSNKISILILHVLDT